MRCAQCVHSVFLSLARAPVTHGFMNGSLSSSRLERTHAVNGPPETAGYTLFPLHQTASSRNAADEGKRSERCVDGRHPEDPLRAPSGRAVFFEPS